MKIHLLPGDSLVEPFAKTGIAGEVLVCRECLIDGDLRADNLAEFWQMREDYLSKSFEKPAGFYRAKVKKEFDKLLAKAPGNEVNLWFEYELFCQVNLWFCLWLLQDAEAELFVVYPTVADRRNIWKGFGWLGSDELKAGYAQRIKLRKKDIALGAKIWKAFQIRDFDTLSSLTKTRTEAFPTLPAVGQAAREIESRPRQTLQKIIAGGTTEFSKVFQEFNRREDIYGFGDSQVKKIFDELKA